MRILFSMRHSGYIRNYQSTLKALLDDGATVHLIIGEREKQGGQAMLDDLSARYPAFSYGRQRLASPKPIVAMRLASDYLRYFVPPYESFPWLRQRVADRMPPAMARLLDRVFGGRPRLAAAATRVIAAVDRTLPPDPEVLAVVREFRPEVVLVTPYVDLGISQCAFVRSARACGIPSALCVNSWDNLTNKGLIRLAPDMVVVWNEAQQREAVDLHGIDPARVRVTGAQAWDHWFTWTASRGREAFCEELGLDPQQAILLYLCSSPQIAPAEVAFVRAWIAALRSSPDARVRGVGVIVRPHPYNHAQWEAADLSDLGHATVWPPAGANPVDESSRNDYFDSMYHAAGIVGINTSGLIEAAVLSRPVYTIKDARFADTQDGTVHFHHLVDTGGGLLQTAQDFDEHVAQIGDLLAGRTTAALAARSESFVRAFVRPHGRDQAATPLVIAAIREVAGWRARVRRPSLPTRVVGRTLYGLGRALDGWVPMNEGGKQRAGSAKPAKLRKPQKEPKPRRHERKKAKEGKSREQREPRKEKIKAPPPVPPPPPRIERPAHRPRTSLPQADGDSGRRQLTVFVHLPKTAGTSLARLLRLRPGETQRCGNVFKGSGGHVPDPDHARTVRRVAGTPGVTFLHGHIPYGVHAFMPPDWDVRYITLLREPVERAISHYYFQLQLRRLEPDQEARIRGKMRARLSPDTPLDVAFSNLDFVPDNLQTRMLSSDPEPFGPVTPAMFDDACRNLERFALAGLSERFDESMVLLARRFDLPAPPVGDRHRVNPARPRGDGIPPEVRDAAERANAFDRALYARAVALFDAAPELSTTAARIDVAALRHARAGSPDEVAGPPAGFDGDEMTWRAAVLRRARDLRRLRPVSPAPKEV